MFRHRKKIGSSLGVRESEEQIRRLFGSDQSFWASPISLDKTDQANVSEDSRRNIRTAMFEAESKKARALMTFQNNERIY